MRIEAAGLGWEVEEPRRTQDGMASQDEDHEALLLEVMSWSVGRLLTPTHPWIGLDLHWC